jgi:hypothetical protein
VSNMPGPVLVDEGNEAGENKRRVGITDLHGPVRNIKKVKTGHISTLSEQLLFFQMS